MGEIGRIKGGRVSLTATEADLLVQILAATDPAEHLEFALPQTKRWFSAEGWNHLVSKIFDVAPENDILFAPTTAGEKG